MLAERVQAVVMVSWRERVGRLQHRLRRVHAMVLCHLLRHQYRLRHRRFRGMVPVFLPEVAQAWGTPHARQFRSIHRSMHRCEFLSFRGCRSSRRRGMVPPRGEFREFRRPVVRGHCRLVLSEVQGDLSGWLRQRHPAMAFLREECPGLSDAKALGLSGCYIRKN